MLHLKREPYANLLVQKGLLGQAILATWLTTGCAALVEKTITFKKLNMSIPVPNFTMLWEKLFFFKFVSLEIPQYFYEVTKENFLVYVSGINPISSRAFTTFLYCWGCHRVWVVKSSYLITLEIINQLM